MPSSRTAPRFLSPSGRRLWARIYRCEGGDRGENPTWRDMLTAFCEAADRLDAAASAIRAEGITRHDRRGVVRCHPAIKEMQRAARDLTRFHALAQLGASRH